MLDNLLQYPIECEVRRHHLLLGTAILRSDSTVSCRSWRTPVMAPFALFPRFPRFRKVRRCRVKAHPKYLPPRRLTALPQLKMPWLLPNFRNSTLALHVLLRKGFAVEPLDDRDCVAQGTDQTLRGREKEKLSQSVLLLLQSVNDQ